MYIFSRQSLLDNQSYHSRYYTIRPVTITTRQSVQSNMPGPSKHRETYVYPVYQRISKIIRWQPDSNTSTQPQGANKDRPAILNPDDYDNLPLDDPPEDKEDRRRWHHMEVVPHPTQEKYFKSEIVVAIVKCVALEITLLGVTFILTVNPTQVVCHCSGISPQMT